MSQSLLITTANAVRTITLNRPEHHNVFDEGLITGLTEAFRQAGADADCRVVVLASTGKSFSAGGDLAWMRRMAEFGPEQNLADARVLAGMLEAIDSCPRPVIGVVQGPAYGGGVGLTSCCDMVVAAEEATFCLSEVKLGLIPATIAPYVVRAMGARAARRYFATAETFDARKALAFGLVHEVVPAERLAEVRDDWIRRLLANGPTAVAANKEMLRHVAEEPLGPALTEWTARRIADLRAGAEGREGVRAFLEKRPPAWRG